MGEAAYLLALAVIVNALGWAMYLFEARHRRAVDALWRDAMEGWRSTIEHYGDCIDARALEVDVLNKTADRIAAHAYAQGAAAERARIVATMLQLADEVDARPEGGRAAPGLVLRLAAAAVENMPEQSGEK